MGSLFAKTSSSIKNRQMESVRLFRPQEHQMPFFLSDAPNRAVIGGNRSGKTMVASIYFSAVATGMDITGHDGNSLSYPFSRDRPLILWVIGYGEKHISSPIYPMLFKAGAFKIIKDAVTSEWRAFHPVLDKDRITETRDAPPLIPPRFIQNIVWTNKGAKQFEIVTLNSLNFNEFLCDRVQYFSMLHEYVLGALVCCFDYLLYFLVNLCGHDLRLLTRFDSCAEYRATLRRLECYRTESL